MSFDIVSYNMERDRLQKVLDAQKTSKERNMKGQFATPYPLACSIMRKAKTLRSWEQKFLRFHSTK